MARSVVSMIDNLSDVSFASKERAIEFWNRLPAWMPGPDHIHADGDEEIAFFWERDPKRYAEIVVGDISIDYFVKINKQTFKGDLPNEEGSIEQVIEVLAKGWGQDELGKEKT